MHEFCQILFYGNQKNWSKTENFSAKEVNILTYLVLWMAYWRCESHAKQSRSFDADTVSYTPVDDRWKCAHDTIQMEFSNMKIVWTIMCRFAAFIQWCVFVVNRTPQTVCKGSLLIEEGRTGSIHPLPKKLACSSCPPLFCPKNVDFAIFMQFLAIFPKMSPSLVKP